jgi:NAD/NADP transhydrogenase beta subunit
VLLISNASAGSSSSPACWSVARSGAVIAKRTPTTQMPEMVAALNGFGGVSSALVAMADLLINNHC